MEDKVKGIHALLVAERARQLQQNVGNARGPEDVDPKNPELLLFEAALAIALEELSDIEGFIETYQP